MKMKRTGMVVFVIVFALIFVLGVYLGFKNHSDKTNIDKTKIDKSKIDKSKTDITEQNQSIERQWIYGITIDDSRYEKLEFSQVIDAIKKLSFKPTVRVVMSKELEPEYYKDFFLKLHEIAYIMATPVDSYEMIHYESVDSYLKRFEESYRELGEYVAIWEIGNEVNGEGWLGDDTSFIVKKISAVYDFLLEKNAKTALTLYYTKPGQQRVQMQDWVRSNLSNSLKEGLDYVFVSYYEDDNEGFVPDWKEIFTQLEADFPNAELGIGECGCTDVKADVQLKKERLKHYYTMPKYNSRFVGGYFWWYWVDDFVIHKEDGLGEFMNELWRSD